MDLTLGLESAALKSRMKMEALDQPCSTTRDFEMKCEEKSRAQNRIVWPRLKSLDLRSTRDDINSRTILIGSCCPH